MIAECWIMSALQKSIMYNPLGTFIVLESVVFIVLISIYAVWVYYDDKRKRYKEWNPPKKK